MTVDEYTRSLENRIAELERKLESKKAESA